jgi:uncharacterized delta-60 repeat protein
MKPARKSSVLDRCILETLESRQMFAAGALDQTFGGSGKLANPFGFDVQDSVPLSDGRIVVIGSLNTDFAVGRLNADGTPDRSFGGGDGLVTTDFGGKHSDTPQQVAVGRDGKIVVAGIKRDAFLAKQAQWAMARYNVDGSLDSTFSGDGKQTIFDFGLTFGISDLQVQSNGKIVFCGDRGAKGGIFSDDNYDFALGRLNANGSLDTTFGDSSGSARKGLVVTGMGDQDFASCLLVQGNGKILVGGSSGGFAGGKFALARFTSDGRLDTTFAKGGKLVFSRFGTCAIRALALQGDGMIVAAGVSDSRMCVLRFNNDGSPEIASRFGVLANLAGGSTELADSIIIPQPGKILIVGHADFPVNTGLKPQLLAVQLLADASLDRTFANQGVAKFEALTSNAGRTTAAFANDGKVVISGGRTIVRFVQSTPRVDVNSAALAFELPGGDGIFQITRDAAYNYPTRVFYQVGGTATPGADYTGPLTSQSPNTQGQVIRFGTGSVIVNGTFELAFRSIEIPAGQTSVLLPVNVVNDSRLEPSETVFVTAQANAAYVRGKSTATVTILDDDQVHVNFQPSGSTPPGYVADVGQIFGNRGDGLAYGWDADNTANARIRNNAGSPDPRYDTLIKMQDGVDRKWEIAVPNGMYTVRIVAGDPSFTDSVYQMNLEGQLALSGTPTGDIRWFRRTINVQVSDGRLTLSNAAGALNNKIAFLDIKSAAPGTLAGPVTNNIAVHLVAPATAPQFHRLPSGLFADNQIDETIWA